MKHCLKILVVIIATAACSNTQTKSLNELFKGLPLYIVSSEATGAFNAEQVQLEPFEATLTVKESNAGYCVLDIEYLFSDRDPSYNRPIKFSIPDVPVETSRNNLGLAGTGLKGTCTFRGEYAKTDTVVDYSDISINGNIGNDGKSNISIAGTFDGKNFSLHINETSFEYPGSQSYRAAEIDWLLYREIEMKNSASTPVVFKIESVYNKKKESVTINPGEETIEGIFIDDDFWFECSLLFSFGEDAPVSVDGNDIVGLKEGEQIGCLKRGKSKRHYYLRAVQEIGLFEPVGYYTEAFEITDPS